MKKYQGSCQCGAVRFEIETDLDRVIECNCSICRKKGALHHRVATENFKLLSGKEDLNLYQFDSKEASHCFCKHCGIHPFSRPRANPKLYSVNVRCLEDVDLDNPDFEIAYFDGKNWEEAIKTFKF